MLESATRRLDLAHANAFALGKLWVEPSLRLVRNGASMRSVEPRVMQLLVALAEGEGQPLSRDDLMRLCWGGVVVGENAIQRAVSQARGIASGIGEGSFEIETVRGVGYRLVRQESSGGPVAAAPGPDRHLSRRTTLTLVGAGAVAAAVPGAFLFSGDSSASKTARELHARAAIALRDENFQSSRQAVALLNDAVRDSPRFASAWASLSLAYWQNLIGLEGREADHFAALAASSARQAISIDPQSVQARGTLAVLDRDFRRWRRTRSDLQAIAGGDRNWAVLRWLGWVSSDLGEWTAAIGQLRHALAVESLLPQARRDLAIAYWGAGRPVEAEQVLADAMRLWPADYGLWEFKFRYLALTGRYSEAAELVRDEAALPLGLGSLAVTKRLALLEALDGERAKRDFVVHTYQEEARQQPLNTVRAAQVFAAINAREELYALLEGYFLARGPFGVPIARHALRPTFVLFLPPLHKFHGEPRFQALMNAVGLKAQA